MENQHQITVDYKEVRVRLKINRVCNIDIVQQQFTAAFFLEASWIDKDLKKHASTDEKNILNTQQGKGKLVIIDDADEMAKTVHYTYFAPMIHFKNLVEFKDEKEEWFKIYDPSPEDSTMPAICCYRLTTTAIFQMIIDAHMFPVDSQLLTIEISSGFESPSSKILDDEKSNLNKYNNYRVKLIQNLSHKYTSSVNNYDFPLRNEYQLQSGVRFVETESNPNTSASGRVYSILKMSAVVKRKPEYWITNIVFPLFLITTISFSFFSVQPQDIPNRSSIVLTMFLTTIAFKFIISDKLPKISYLSLIDYYLIFCLLLQFAGVVIIVINGIDAINQGTDSYEFNNQPGRTLGYLILFWLILHIIAISVIIILNDKNDRKYLTTNQYLWVTGLKINVKSE